MIQGIFQYFSLGKRSGIKCKRESTEPRLQEFIEVLDEFWPGAPKLIQVVTDDSQISEEISTISKEGFEFLKPDPAPKRIPDNVRHRFHNEFTEPFFSKVKVEFLNIGL